jgi:hypothetical protein
MENTAEGPTPMTLAQEKIACPTMTKPARGQAFVLARGWAFLARLLLIMQGSRCAEDDIFRRYESCRWCDSTERQLNNEIMFGGSARF